MGKYVREDKLHCEEFLMRFKKYRARQRAKYLHPLLVIYAANIRSR
jgi:hypothetical protein